MSVEAFHTYSQARQSIQDQFPGQRIRVAGAITLYVEIGGQMTPVTNVKVDADEKARQYRKAGCRIEWRVSPNLQAK